ncbi:hypothetical protein CAPTEDRAFT_206692 [Capitella teleta]|uniref:Uncharacterized protein n=1 Tax=Capitella teleta TaxID=283909 RepID=R7V6S9_CAPTE|nr:hypothetical protein CAPTEDRAFT_206692 [Capitella teleta]|eukprot:ELU14259.1 hypothetical protein CAPTEDRAFT_206692 [Capitella teleta]
MECALREIGLKYNLRIGINQLKEEQLNESDEVYTLAWHLTEVYQLMEYVLMNLARVTECGSEDDLHLVFGTLNVMRKHRRIKNNKQKQKYKNKDESDEVYTLAWHLTEVYQLIEYVLLNLARVTECGSEDELQLFLSHYHSGVWFLVKCQQYFQVQSKTMFYFHEKTSKN